MVRQCQVCKKSSYWESHLSFHRHFDAIETIHVENKMSSKYNTQPFDYLLVLDFEATCWDRKDSNKGSPEIIEFPCVLYDIKKSEIVAEFQQYVIPTEKQKLSSFCKQLTGIRQNQVDNGVPLNTCLMLFKKWLNEQTEQYNLSFELSSCSSKKCIFATWSDWDLEICLKRECKRKRINLSDIFRRWMDVRALYREHYLRRPKGLHGALLELGLVFEGKEHCGLHDAKNTAKLIGRMVADGVLLRTTKDISITIIV